MSRKHFSWLLVITLIVAALVLLVPGKTSKQSNLEKSRFLPALQDKVNDVDWLRVAGAGDATIATLERKDGQWVVDEVSGYAADWGRLRSLLSDLAQAEIVEAKTDNPEYYPRLGVEDVADKDATGTLLQFSDASGLPAVIVGKPARNREGQYARLDGTAESVLLDRPLNVPAKAIDWVQRDIIDIPDAEVVEVRIVHPDGERVVTKKASADDENFTLQDVPDGREVKSEWSVDSLANGLAALTLDAVAPIGDIDWDGSVQYSVISADGLKVDVWAVERKAEGDATGAENDSPDTQPAPTDSAEYWIKLKAELYTTAVDSGIDPDADSETTADRARKINARVDGWAYRIPKYKFDTLNKRMEDLLKQPESS
ncbi:MAG: DUF4340 domain-containing protein [Lysobacterales bacterium]|jgi:hypothetical protein